MEIFAQANALGGNCRSERQNSQQRMRFDLAQKLIEGLRDRDSPALNHHRGLPKRDSAQAQGSFPFRGIPQRSALALIEPIWQIVQPPDQHMGVYQQSHEELSQSSLVSK